MCRKQSLPKEAKLAKKLKLLEELFLEELWENLVFAKSEISMKKFKSQLAEMNFRKKIIISIRR